jgi:hypothetical protein
LFFTNNECAHRVSCMKLVLFKGFLENYFLNRNQKVSLKDPYRFLPTPIHTQAAAFAKRAHYLGNIMSYCYRLGGAKTYAGLAPRTLAPIYNGAHTLIPHRQFLRSTFSYWILLLSLELHRFPCPPTFHS